MNPATINQSSRLITDAIYANEYFENQDEKERTAITMDEFHRQTIVKQLEDYANRKKEIEKSISLSKEQEKLKENSSLEREKYYKELELKHQWDPFKNHWYWGEYANEKSSITPSPTSIPSGLSGSTTNIIIDNLDSDNVVKIELSPDYKTVDSGNRLEVLEGTPINSSCIYRAPFREYCYDYKNDKLIPNDKRYITDTNVLNLEQKCLNDNSETEAFNRKLEEKTEEKPKIKEGFEDLVDSKLMKIYSKTLSPQDDLEKSEMKLVSNFTYWQCLIIIIIFFLLFR
jgi:hypothetical protein